MEIYEQLRHFADSWGLLLMMLFFVAAMAWAFRPGARQRYREQADIIFKHDDRKG
jgi:cytochrome c oxidase cbb3-type subunit 4